MNTPPATDQYDQIIADADWSVDGFAEIGPFSLLRDAVGFVTVIEWVDNEEVVRAYRKG